MPNVRHRVNDYKVDVSLTRVGASGSAVTRTERNIVLTTEPLHHGLTITVTLGFSNFFDAFTSTPVVGFYMGRDTFTHRVVVWLPVREFEFYYDLLRNEKPVFYDFDYNDSGTLVGYLTRFALTTGTERPGEGDPDVTELMSLAEPERLAVQSVLGSVKTAELTMGAH